MNWEAFIFVFIAGGLVFYIGKHWRKTVKAFIDEFHDL